MWEATWSQGWEHKAARQVIQMIGAEIVALNTKFPCLQNWVHGTFRKLVRFAAVGIKKSCPENGPRNEAGSRTLCLPIQRTAVAQMLVRLE